MKSILDTVKPIKDAIDGTVESAVRSAESLVPPLPGMKGGFPQLPKIPIPDAISKMGLGPVYKQGPDEYPPVKTNGERTRAQGVDSLRFETKY